MNKQMDFERWAPPTVNEAGLRAEYMRRKKRKLLALVSSMLTFDFLLALLLVWKVAEQNVASGVVGFCCIGGVLTAFSVVVMVLLNKRRDYFYD